MKMPAVFASLALFLFAAPCLDAAAGAGTAGAATGCVSLSVRNASGIGYGAHPVTSGIPLSEGMGVVDAAELGIFDSKGAPLPAQFRVLSRWSGAVGGRSPVKWVLADFQADVPANRTSSYCLKKVSRQPQTPGISVVETQKAVTVDTGAAVFVISKERFNIFEKVTLAGETSVLVDGAAGGGALITREQGSFSTGFDAPDVTVEEEGPMRTVVRVSGRFRDHKGRVFTGGDARMYWPEKNVTPLPENYPITYTARIHAYRGKAYARLVYTLENNGNTISYAFPVNDAFIDGSYLSIVPAFGPDIRVTASSYSSQVMKEGGAFSLYQGHALNDQKDEAANFTYDIRRNGQRESGGKRSEGWVDFSSEGGGVAVGVRDFWQRYPKSIEYANGSVRIGLLPEENAVREKTGYFSHYSNGNYYFSGGWHMTDEVYLFFHGKGANVDEVSSTMARLGKPLYAACEPAWYAESKAWGLIAPYGFRPGEPAMKKAIERYEAFQRMFIDGSAEAMGRDIVRLREMRNMGRDHYGWEDFGDMAHGWGLFSSLIYDWPYVMWLQFIRTGDERFLALARELTGHSVDMDQIHYHDPGKLYDGIWHWENIGSPPVNGHHKSLQGAGGIVSHTWNGGYSLGYLLTGEGRYLEAAKRGANAGRAFWGRKDAGRDAIGGQKVKYDQTRSQGWTILMLVNEYRLTGELKNLNDAMAVFRNSLLYTERLNSSPGSGGKGYITVEKSGDKSMAGKAVVTFLTYPLEPLCELHYEASRAGIDAQELEAYLVRALDWLKDYAYVGGITRGDGMYSYLTITYATDPLEAANNNGGELAHNIHVAGAFGYGAMMLREKEPGKAAAYMDFARRLFRDLMYYRTEQKKSRDDYHDAGRLSPITWGWLPTAPKEMGYIGRGGQFYLYAERERFFCCRDAVVAR